MGDKKIIFKKKEVKTYIYKERLNESFENMINNKVSVFNLFQKKEKKHQTRSRMQ